MASPSRRPGHRGDGHLRRDADAAGGESWLSVRSPSPERWTKRCSIELGFGNRILHHRHHWAEAERSTVTAEQSVTGRLYDCGDAYLVHTSSGTTRITADGSVFKIDSFFDVFIDVSLPSAGLAFVGPIPLVAVPEPSIWAMMLLGFAGLGFAGYRSTRRTAGVT